MYAYPSHTTMCIHRTPPSKFLKFKPSRFEPLYQPYFGFWLFPWSRCGRIVKKSSRKDLYIYVYIYICIYIYICTYVCIYVYICI